MYNIHVESYTYMLRTLYIHAYFSAVYMAEEPPKLWPTSTVLVMSLSFRNSTVSLAKRSKVISETCGLSPWFLMSRTNTLEHGCVCARVKGAQLTSLNVLSSRVSLPCEARGSASCAQLPACRGGRSAEEQRRPRGRTLERRASQPCTDEQLLQTLITQA